MSALVEGANAEEVTLWPADGIIERRNSQSEIQGPVSPPARNSDASGTGGRKSGIFGAGRRFNSSDIKSIPFDIDIAGRKRSVGTMTEGSDRMSTILPPPPPPIDMEMARVGSPDRKNSFPTISRSPAYIEETTAFFPDVPSSSAYPEPGDVQFKPPDAASSLHSVSPSKPAPLDEVEYTYGPDEDGRSDFEYPPSQGRFSTDGTPMSDTEAVFGPSSPKRESTQEKVKFWNKDRIKGKFGRFFRKRKEEHDNEENEENNSNPKDEPDVEASNPDADDQQEQDQQEGSGRRSRRDQFHEELESRLSDKGRKASRKPVYFPTKAPITLPGDGAKDSSESPVRLPTDEIVYVVPQHKVTRYEDVLSDKKVTGQNTDFVGKLNKVLKLIFTHTQDWTFIILATVFGVIFSALWGFLFGLVNFIIVWLAQPSLRLVFIITRLFSALWWPLVKTTLEPVCRSISSVFRNMGARITMETTSASGGQGWWQWMSPTNQATERYKYAYTYTYPHDKAKRSDARQYFEY